MTLAIITLIAPLWLLSRIAWSAELVMLEQAGCPSCNKWKKEIGGIYHKTPEGKQAPLRMLNIYDKKPADLEKVQLDRFTPTFILVENGLEVARLRGYSGDEFFWFQLQEMLDQLPTTHEAEPVSSN